MHPPMDQNKAKDGKSNDAKTNTYCAVPTCCIPFGDPGVIPAGFEFANWTITGPGLGADTRIPQRSCPPPLPTVPPLYLTTCVRPRRSYKTQFLTRSTPGAVRFVASGD